MNDEDFLNEGLAEAVAQAEALLARRKVASPAPQPDPMSAPKVQGPKAPRFGRGGVIRNPNTKVRTQLANPLTNPRPPSKPSSNVAEPTPEEEAKAQHPALAFPSIFTGMDMDTVKGPPLPEPVDRASPALLNHHAPDIATQQPRSGEPIGYETTLRVLLQRGIEASGAWHVGNETFYVSVQILDMDRAIALFKSLG